MKLLSIIVPCYNEQENIEIFYEEVSQFFPFLKENELDYEFIFVDDGSNDNTLANFISIREKDPRIKWISFSRNFGKDAALLAGMEASKGDLITVMDVDLQDPPSLLPIMIEKIKEGYDCVTARRVSRKGEPLIRSFFAQCFYKILHKMTKMDIADGARDFRMFNRKVLNAILSLEEYTRFSKGIFSWVGFKNCWLEYENVERKNGETKWSFGKLLLYSLEGITSFSTVPLAFAGFTGLFFCFIAFLAILFIVIRTLIFGDPVGGWPSLVCIIAFISGIQLFCIGILGQYMSKIFLEIKKRPHYIIQSDWKESEDLES